MKYLVKCPHCGQIYNCEGKVVGKTIQYITDYNDNVTEKCLVCKKNMKPDVIKTDDWIANLIFRIKGN